MKRCLFTLSLLALVAASNVALAAPCPPDSNQWASYGFVDSERSSDRWFSELWCGRVTPSGIEGGDPATRTAVINLVRDHMGLQQDIDIWGGMLNEGNSCNPTTWGMRLINGAYFADYVGEMRDHDTFPQVRSPGTRLPGGALVTRWLSQYIDYYARSQGFDFECLASGDVAGDNMFTFASNPAVGANNLYFPFFWVSTPVGRAATIVHEASHEFAGHVSDSDCMNGASCDDFFPNANAQTIHSIFTAQAIDAYKKVPGTRELAIANFGDGTCGYIPLLPEGLRVIEANGLIMRMQRMFRRPPPLSSWPIAYRYDTTQRDDGTTDIAFEIDRQNGAKWTCDIVCNVADFQAGGARFCNEQTQPDNAARNAANLSACNDINADATTGMTAAQLAALRDRNITDMQSCLVGYSQTYLDSVCTEVRGRSSSVDEIATNWPELKEGYSYNEDEAIRTCQASFCAVQGRANWNGSAAPLCYEWDDSTGCLERACGDLAEIAARAGRSSLEYLNAVVCRESDIASGGGRIDHATSYCERQFDACLVGDRYMTAWLHQLENPSNDCWMAEGKALTGDPLFMVEYKTIGQGDASTWFNGLGERAVFIQSPCTLQRVLCESTQNTLYAAAAKIAAMNMLHVPDDSPFPRPDPAFGIFDGELLDELIDLGGYYSGGSVSKPLASDERLLRLATIPEATVGVAQIVGLGTFFRGGGGLFSDGLFSPRTVTLFAGVAPVSDPYAMPVASFGVELDALSAMSTQLAAEDALSLYTDAIVQGGATGVYEHMQAVLASHDGMALLAAYEALMADAAP